MRMLLLPAAVALLTTVASAELVWDKTLDERTIQHGERELRVVFPFKNAGREPIEITQLITSCGCTAAVVEPRVVKPGETGEVTGIFRPGDRVGLQHNTIDVRTAPPSVRRNRLTMRTSIERDVYLDRTVLFWARERPPQPVVVRARILARDPMEIVGAQSSDPRLRVALGTVKKSSVYQIEVTPLDLREPFDATITVRAARPDGTTRDSEILATIR